MLDNNEQPQMCYFCNDADLNSCVNRSLYHKYNDSTNKLMYCIDEIINTNKQRSIRARKYEQMKHLIDDNENITKYLTNSKGLSEFLDLLQYYKFRKFVPIFAKSIDNSKITEKLHVFYYDKLKIYYNQIKKMLNITVEQSSKSESSNSFITKTQISDYDSKILNQLTIKGFKQSFRNFQSQSKALQDLLNILKKQQDRLQKIKSLRTEDCTRQNNQFKDNMQKQSKLAQYFAQNKHIVMKKNKRMFFRNIQAKTYKNEQNLKYNAIKKFIGQQSKASLYYQSIKLRSNIESVCKTKKQTSKTNNQRVILKSKPILQKSQHRKSCQNLNERNLIKSLPKVQMQFNIRPSRSLSYVSIINTNKQNSANRLSTKLMVVKKQTNNTKIEFVPEKNQKKKKIEPIKTPCKDQIQIDPNDNLASINRKKIQQLKIKSQRKKQAKK